MCEEWPMHVSVAMVNEQGAVNADVTLSGIAATAFFCSDGFVPCCNALWVLFRLFSGCYCPVRCVPKIATNRKTMTLRIVFTYSKKEARSLKDSRVSASRDVIGVGWAWRAENAGISFESSEVQHTTDRSTGEGIQQKHRQ